MICSLHKNLVFIILRKVLKGKFSICVEKNESSLIGNKKLYFDKCENILKV